MVLEAVKVALDPSPAQERLLLSHAGAARFAFNAGLAHVQEAIEAGVKPEWSFYSLVRWWNANKDALAVSKTCSKCGRVKAKLSLAERVYRCDGCGLVMDRDLNAAVNILVAGSAPETVNAHRGTVSRGGQPGRATRVPVKCEPSVGGNVVSDLERVPARTPCKLQQTSL